MQICVILRKHNAQMILSVELSQSKIIKYIQMVQSKNHKFKIKLVFHIVKFQVLRMGAHHNLFFMDRGQKNYYKNKDVLKCVKMIIKNVKS